MASIRRTPKPNLPPDWLIGIFIALVVTVIPSLVQHFLDKYKYDSAVLSYHRGDCPTAVQQFHQVTSAFRLVDIGDYVPRAEAKKAECEFFEDALSAQQIGKFESALLSYAKLAVYDNSSLLEPTREQIRQLFQKAQITSFATIKVCSRLGILAERNLLPTSDPNLPSLYPECAKAYEAKKSYKEAISTYEQFLQHYLDHALTEDVKRFLAQATVADVRERGARNIKSPAQTGITLDASTVIEIQNTSPAKMQITFSGVTPRFEKLESCRDCLRYVNHPPKLCSGKGPVGRYTLEPGQYDIAVQADDRGSVRPWAGTWTLKAGAEYKSCFFIITNPVHEANKQENHP